MNRPLRRSELQLFVKELQKHAEPRSGSRSALYHSPQEKKGEIRRQSTSLLTFKPTATPSESSETQEKCEQYPSHTRQPTLAAANGTS
ncbi:hypothetical protein CA13_73150 [Planctomycetes bacterium CA13]|uniref:Uncharacterized protein n=1 Tax=Novipirellula herctigrandis TaxID=2527986 RepID=A0A5C5YLI2_9BACT|nr:hypothetical protein CA13_73150 [Planctomycetes bacterium CA13]